MTLKQAFWLTAFSLASTGCSLDVTVRSVAIYDLAGKLSNMAFVVNFRGKDGQPVKNVPCDCRIVGPWGTNGWSQGRPVRDGFLFLSGPGNYLAGWYRFSGKVNGQYVTKAVLAPIAKQKIAVTKGYVAAWLNANDAMTSVWIRPTVKGWSRNFVLGWLFFEDDKGDQSKQYWRGPGGTLSFDIPKPLERSRMWSELFLFNVPELYAPSQDPNQPLMALNVSTVWFQKSQLTPRKWWNVTDERGQ